MNKRLIGLLAGATLLAACGSDNAPTASSVCSKFSSEWPSVLSKVQAPECSVTATALQPYGRFTDAQTCSSLVQTQCSSDIPKIDTFLNCMNELPTCNASNVQTWGVNCFALVSGPSGLSQACLGAVMTP